MLNNDVFLCLLDRCDYNSLRAISCVNNHLNGLVDQHICRISKESFRNLINLYDVAFEMNNEIMRLSDNHQTLIASEKSWFKLIAKDLIDERSAINSKLLNIHLDIKPLKKDLPSFLEKNSFCYDQLWHSIAFGLSHLKGGDRQKLIDSINLSKNDLSAIKLDIFDQVENSLFTHACLFNISPVLTNKKQFLQLAGKNQLENKGLEQRINLTFKFPYLTSLDLPLKYREDKIFADSLFDKCQELGSDGVNISPKQLMEIKEGELDTFILNFDEHQIELKTLASQRKWWKMSSPKLKQFIFDCEFEEAVSNRSKVCK